MDDWVPSVSQAKLYNANQHYLHAVGGWRSGKTEVYFKKIRKECLLQPGLEVLITRDTGPALYGRTRDHFLNIFEEKLFLDYGEKPNPWYQLRNGSIIYFIAYENIDQSKAGGTQYGMIFMNEASRFTFKQWLYFDGRLSQKFGNAIAPDGKKYKNPIQRRFLMTDANPAGRGYLWQIYRRDHPLSFLGQDKDYFAVECFTKELQERVDPEYWKRVQATVPLHMQGKLLGADESPMQGLCFPNMDRSLCVYDSGGKGYVPPGHWPIYIGMDFGYQTPTVALWCAITEEGCIIVFKEYRQNMTSIPENTKNIMNITQDFMYGGMGEVKGAFIDPSTGFKDGKSHTGASVFEQYINAGFWNLELSYRIPVIDRVNKTLPLLSPDPKIQHHPISGIFREKGWPRLIFVDVCEETIKEHEEWEWDESPSDKRDPKNKPKEKDDHGPDALSYFLIKHFDEKAPENPIDREKRERDVDYQFKQQVLTDMQGQMDRIKKGIRTKRSSMGTVR